MNFEPLPREDIMKGEGHVDAALRQGGLEEPGQTAPSNSHGDAAAAGDEDALNRALLESDKGADFEGRSVEENGGLLKSPMLRQPVEVHRLAMWTLAALSGLFFLAAFAGIVFYVASLLIKAKFRISLCQGVDPSISSSSQQRVPAPSVSTVILISSDGFRWGYEHKVPTPNINRLKSNGTEAAEGMIPIFPSVTFPNHYSIVTGLYAGSHGIVANSFPDPNNSSRKFTMGSHEADWWLGEPIWETAVKQGRNAATFFWPGSEVEREHWKCPPEFCMPYNGAVQYEKRVDKVLEWMDLPEETRPNIVTLYFEEPDHTGHQAGPDVPEIGNAITRIDTMVGRLLDGLEERNLLQSVHIIMLGDHGMLGNCASREIYAEDFKQWVPNITASWFSSYSPLMAIHPPPGLEVQAVYNGLKAGLASNKVNKGKYLSVYLKEELPERFKYNGSERIAPILGVLAEGYTAKFRKGGGCTFDCSGSHGYDNTLLSMRTIFIAHGPRFAPGRKVDSFVNVEVYGVIANILGLEAAPNNGSASFPDHILLPIT